MILYVHDKILTEDNAWDVYVFTSVYMKSKYVRYYAYIIRRCE